MSTHYRDRLERLLIDRGFKVFLIDNDAPWWADRLWVIRSIRHAQSAKIYVSFLIEPESDYRADPPDVWAIAAHTRRPDAWQDKKERIICRQLQKGRQQEALRELVDAICAYRDSLDAKSHGSTEGGNAGHRTNSERS